MERQRGLFLNQGGELRIDKGVTAIFGPVFVESTRFFSKLPVLPDHVPIYAASFAMLSLAPFMDLDVPS
jgi:hypothetical protein